MFFGNTPPDTRQMFLESFRKYRLKEVMTPLEIEIASVINLHPEYHTFLEKNDAGMNRVFESYEDNPFLHMGLHIAVREQLSIDRPAGICKTFQQLLKKGLSPHLAEHELISCLKICLSYAQENGRMPDEATYMALLSGLMTE